MIISKSGEQLVLPVCVVWELYPFFFPSSGSACTLRGIVLSCLLCRMFFMVSSLISTPKFVWKTVKQHSLQKSESFKLNAIFVIFHESRGEWVGDKSACTCLSAYIKNLNFRVEEVMKMVIFKKYVSTLIHMYSNV